MRINSEIIHLRPWEEYVGVPTEFVDEDDIPHANFGKISLALPIEMADELKSHIGQRIAIIRTDDQARPYRFRRVMEMKNSPAGAANTGLGDENFALVSKAQVPPTKIDVTTYLGGSTQ